LRGDFTTSGVREKMMKAKNELWGGFPLVTRYWRIRRNRASQDYLNLWAKTSPRKTRKRTTEKKLGTNSLKGKIPSHRDGYWGEKNVTNPVT